MLDRDARLQKFIFGDDVPLPLDADAYTACGQAFAGGKAKEKSVYNVTFRRSPKDAWPQIAGDGRTVFYGLPDFVRECLVDGLFSSDMVLSERFMETAHSFGGPLNFDADLWRDARRQFKGNLPIKIEALPTGSTFFPNEPVVQVASLGTGYGEIAASVEASLLGMVACATARATVTRHLLERMRSEYRLNHPGSTALEADSVARFMVHDFGKRASSTPLEARIFGRAHLLSFHGTDTFDAAYQAWASCDDKDEFRPGGTSILAHAHRIILGHDSEGEAVRALADAMDAAGDFPIASFLADTFDFKNFVDRLAVPLALEMKSRGRGGAVVVRPDCYDDQTEILTDAGWKFFRDVSPEDRVAQYTHKGGVEFVSPSRVYDEPYCGEMIHFTNDRSVDLLVTPNHRMVKLSSANGRVVIEHADDVVFSSMYRQPVAGTKAASSGRRLTDLERFYIAFQADGSYRSKMPRGMRRTRSHVVRFNFSKQRKIDRLIDICERAGFKFSVHREPARADQTTIYVDVGHWPKKTFEEWVDLASVDAIWGEEFLDEMSHWDSTVRAGGRIKYSSQHKSNVDLVQAIAHMSGAATCYACEPAKKETHSDHHILHIRLRHAHHDSQSICRERVHYDGRVYCVTVPSGMVIVRRNGRVAVSGNSGNYLANIDYVVKQAFQHGVYSRDEYGRTVATNLRFIFGDSVNPEKLDRIFGLLRRLNANTVRWGIFGIGGWLRNQSNRDALSAAYKLASKGHRDEPVVKLSEVAAKLSVPGPNAVLRPAFPDLPTTYFASDPFVEEANSQWTYPDRRSAYVTYYDGSKPGTDAIGDACLEPFTEHRRRAVEEFDLYRGRVPEQVLSPAVLACQRSVALAHGRTI